MIEIMIVVLIIGILLAIAVPNFVRARASSRLKSVVANLKQIDSAVQQWASRKQTEASGSCGYASQPVDGTAGGTTAYLAWPTGPVAGNYAVSTVGATATFDGGSKGAMDSTGWQTTCTAGSQHLRSLTSDLRGFILPSNQTWQSSV